MTTPSGTISAQDVANEFGLGHPIRWSDFYGKGRSQGGGTISLGDMRNRTAISITWAGSTATPQNGATYAVTDGTVSLAANGYSISVTQNGSLGSPLSGTYSNGVGFSGAPQTKADRTVNWSVSLNGITFSVVITTTGSLNS